ncbi:hypothetical protein DM860_009061 [Cuscuta australis]|uniref:Uncharacterized protein n=1 Tax=Cuscuta australis TaxID=267555 RepID=A0A328DC20_9ASTE|nr:hypothetical protein DM860_009061 [Cuscuta australis]
MEARGGTILEEFQTLHDNHCDGRFEDGDEVLKTLAADPLWYVLCFGAAVRRPAGAAASGRRSKVLGERRSAGATTIHEDGRNTFAKLIMWKADQNRNKELRKIWTFFGP